MTLDERIREAARLGEKAFNEGRGAVPALDPNLRPLLKGNECLPVIVAWSNAWHKANLDAPVIVDGVDIVKEIRGPR